MLPVLENVFRKLDGYRYKHKMENALALHLRGEVRRDGLNLTRATTHLEIEWRARDIHPWDRDLLSPVERAAAFVKQLLVDTEAAVCRLFEGLPQVDVITLRVLDEISDNPVISGTVSRADILARNERLSIGMRLRYLGLTYQLAGSLYEALDEGGPSVPIADAGIASAFQTEEPLAKPMCRRDLKVR